jgi:shikimate 5-dehydrogenase
MMEASFAHEGLDWRYVNGEVVEDQFAAAVSGAAAMGWRGFNCSIPHKQAVIPLLDDLAARLASVGRSTAWCEPMPDGSVTTPTVSVSSPRPGR